MRRRSLPESSQKCMKSMPLVKVGLGLKYPNQKALLTDIKKLYSRSKDVTLINHCVLKQECIAFSAYQPLKKTVEFTLRLLLLLSCPCEVNPILKSTQLILKWSTPDLAEQVDRT